MGRPKKSESEIMVNEGLRVPPEASAELGRIAAKYFAAKAYIARELFMRGLAAYKRDNLLSEPEEETNISRIARVTTQKGNLNDAKPKRAIDVSKNSRHRANLRRTKP